MHVVKNHHQTTEVKHNYRKKYIYKKNTTYVVSALDKVEKHNTDTSSHSVVMFPVNKTDTAG